MGPCHTWELGAKAETSPSASGLLPILCSNAIETKSQRYTLNCFENGVLSQHPSWGTGSIFFSCISVYYWLQRECSLPGCTRIETREWLYFWCWHCECLYLFVFVCGEWIVGNVLGQKFKGNNNELFSFFISEILARFRRDLSKHHKIKRIQTCARLTKLRG